MIKYLKKAILPAILILMFAGVSAQDNSVSEDSVAAAYAQQQTVIYRLAKYFGDSEVARGALYNLISLNTDNTQLLDTLSLEYYEKGNWLSAALVGQEVVRMDPEDVFALEITASALENLGAKAKALENYESLYLKNENISVLYKVAFLQYELKKYVEAKATAEALLSKKEAKELMVVFQKADKTSQEVSMEASVFNLLGLIARDEKDKSAAMTWFNKALAVAPEFELAKNNLQNLDK